MATRDDYLEVVLESFLREHKSGHRDAIGIRPARGQLYPQSMEVECSRHMINPERYPLGSLFLARVCVKQKQNDRPHLYSYHGSAIVTMSKTEATTFIAKYPKGRAVQ